MKNELYYEEYDNVAVMFASIKNYDIESVGLRVLNEIICDFDEVVSFVKLYLTYNLFQLIFIYSSNCLKRKVCLRWKKSKWLVGLIWLLVV